MAEPFDSLIARARAAREHGERLKGRLHLATPAENKAIAKATPDATRKVMAIT